MNLMSTPGRNSGRHNASIVHAFKRKKVILKPNVEPVIASHTALKSFPL